MKLHLLSIVLVLGIAACRRDVPITPPLPTPSTLRLKDMTERNLPSPSYHFAYNDDGTIAQASIYSGLAIYNVRYSGKNISALESTINRDTLQYEYTGSNLTVIRVKNVQGVVYRRCLITCNAVNQLLELEWQVKDGDIGYAVERLQQFSYYPDGNLQAVFFHFFAVGSQTEAMYTDTYGDYDDKVNADGFSLLHPFQLEHLILLPDYRLQLNNPRRQVHTGDGTNYEVTYSYTYDAAGRPVIKNGDVLFTNGPDNGTHFQSQETFSYYD
jgi:hypothetical protein